MSFHSLLSRNVNLRKVAFLRVTAFLFHKFHKGEISQSPAWDCLVQFMQMQQSAPMRVTLGRRKHAVERLEREGLSHAESSAFCPTSPVYVSLILQ